MMTILCLENFQSYWIGPITVLLFPCKRNEICELIPWANSLQVAWGKISMLDAEKRLLAHALQDPDNQQFVLLSDRWSNAAEFSYHNLYVNMCFLLYDVILSNYLLSFPVACHCITSIMCIAIWCIQMSAILIGKQLYLVKRISNL